jgi:hypothetical protein
MRTRSWITGLIVSGVVALPAYGQGVAAVDDGKDLRVIVNDAIGEETGAGVDPIITGTTPMMAPSPAVNGGTPLSDICDTQCQRSRLEKWRDFLAE